MGLPPAVEFQRRVADVVRAALDHDLATKEVAWASEPPVKSNSNGVMPTIRQAPPPAPSAGGRVVRVARAVGRFGSFAEAGRAPTATISEVLCPAPAPESVWGRNCACRLTVMVVEAARCGAISASSLRCSASRGQMSARIAMRAGGCVADEPS